MAKHEPFTSVVVDDKAVHTALAEISHEVAKQLSTVLHDGEHYDAMACIERIPALERQAQSTLLEIGRMFRALQIERGAQFEAFVTSSGYTLRYATKMAALYERLRIGDRRELVKLGPSKVLELMQESDESLDALSSGRRASNVTLDDIDAMTVRELRSHLRKARESTEAQREAQDKLISKRDAKIAKLQKALDLGERYPSAERAADIYADIARASAKATACAHELVQRVEQMQTLARESEVPEATLELCRHALSAALDAMSALDGALG